MILLPYENHASLAVRPEKSSMCLTAHLRFFWTPQLRDALIFILALASFHSVMSIFFSFSAYAAVVLPVPFTSQAPFGSWAAPYQDFCEEASVVMAAHFVWNIPLTPTKADREMKIVKQFTDLLFKRSKDNSAEEASVVLKTLYGFRNITVKEIKNKEDLVRELSSGRIVITPVAGRLLKNPHFTSPGPLYHMLVIKGYDAASGEFIANDPGTRRGNGIRYRADILFNAIHDWNNGDVLNGKKTVIAAGR